ncbi:MAG: hypothetical protein DWQ37_03550 [Planctomycetota bacterium]|nr:MAG: hypothetical protein DWQ37_03550 [Planctomycetota bacterium]
MITRNTSYGHADLPGRSSAPSIREMCGVFYRHRRKMAVVFFSTLALFAIALVFLPRTYTSEARLFVRLGKESVSLDPTATMNEVVGINESRESEINSELEILRSRALLEDVVQQLGAKFVLTDGDGGEGGSWLQSVTAPAKAVKTWLHGDISEDEKAITKLEKTITVSSPRKSSILLVKSKAKNPKKAQEILQAFLNAYQVHHGHANRIAGSHQFFVNQADLLETQLAAAEEDLRDAKNQNGIASIEGRRANVEAQANSIELAMLENQRSLSSANAKVAALKKTLAELPEKQLAETTDSPSGAVEEMRAELYRLQIQEKEASSRYTPLHPRVIALRRQVDETRKILASEEARSSHATHRISPVRQSVETDLAATQALAASHKAEADSLQQQFEAVQSKIRALNDDELRITKLSRKSELLETSFQNYHKNREQARIDAALEAGRISNVNIVQPATYVAKPSSPPLKLTLVLGVLLAGLGAVLVALAAEHFDRSMRTPEQIEQELGIPVLFSVPRGASNEIVNN